MEERDDLLQLLSLCLHDHSRQNWESFIRLSQPVIAAGVLRALDRCGYRDRQVADDLIQDTYHKLCRDNCRALRSFRGTSSKALRVFLRIAAAHVAMDFLDTQFSASNNNGVSPVSLDDPNSSISPADNTTVKEIERRSMIDQIEKCLAAQSARDRSIFWLYHRHGYRPAAIAALPAIELEKDGIETILYRLTIAVRECVRKSERFRAAGEGVSR